MAHMPRQPQHPHRHPTVLLDPRHLANSIDMHGARVGAWHMVLPTAQTFIRVCLPSQHDIAGITTCTSTSAPTHATGPYAHSHAAMLMSGPKVHCCYAHARVLACVLPEMLMMNNGRDIVEMVCQGYESPEPDEEEAKEKERQKEKEKEERKEQGKEKKRQARAGRGRGSSDEDDSEEEEEEEEEAEEDIFSFGRCWGGINISLMHPAIPTLDHQR